MKIRSQWLLAFPVIAFAFAQRAEAHHSTSIYDTKQTITVQGVVKKYEWANPHVYVYVEETNAAGEKIEWEIECFPPVMLRRLGWSPEFIRVGEVITAIGSPTRKAASHGLFPSVIKRGDTQLFAAQEVVKRLSDPNTGFQPSVATNSLNGVWSTSMASMQLLRQAGKPDPSTLTKEGAAAFQRYDEKTSPSSHCIPNAAPMVMLFPDFKRLTIGDDAVQIEAEYEGTRRTVHMRQATHEGAIPSLQGHSIGRWEGKTLVIETVRFAYHAIGNGGGNGSAAGLPSGTGKHLIERLTPSADGKSLTYSFELTDPEFLATRRTGEVQWSFAPNAKFVAEKCNLESARRFLKD